MKHRINIEEILSRIVEVEADSEDEAEEIVKKKYKNGEIVLSSEDFQKVGFYIQ